MKKIVGLFTLPLVLSGINAFSLTSNIYVSHDNSSLVKLNNSNDDLLNNNSIIHNNKNNLVLNNQFESKGKHFGELNSNYNNNIKLNNLFNKNVATNNIKKSGDENHYFNLDDCVYWTTKRLSDKFQIKDYTKNTISKLNDKNENLVNTSTYQIYRFNS